ncbi:translation initiation factor IF-2-like [Panthera pardus]|uniref:Translation initiation factor IF-2-like n=1 Tax=Panthera pardus TaxID=9691 RepID=A0A9W2VRV2_PANPR|nr:translation initiation factor IF-2-like [Panthera pardus]
MHINPARSLPGTPPSLLLPEDAVPSPLVPERNLEPPGQQDRRLLIAPPTLSAATPGAHCWGVGETSEWPPGPEAYADLGLPLPSSKWPDFLEGQWGSCLRGSQREPRLDQAPSRHWRSCPGKSPGLPVPTWLPAGSLYPLGLGLPKAGRMGKTLPPYLPGPSPRPGMAHRAEARDPEGPAAAPGGRVPRPSFLEQASVQSRCLDAASACPSLALGTREAARILDVPALPGSN